MPLIDTGSGAPWSPQHMNAMLGHVRAACVTTLRARDAERGIPADGKVYTDEETDPTKPGKLRVDQDLAAKKATGRNVRLLTACKWSQFCSEPRDEAHYMEELGLAVSAKDRTRADAESAILEDEVPDELAASVRIPGLDLEHDAAGDDTEPAAAAPTKRDPKRRRRYGS